MLPFRAQRAAQGIEDGAVLAACLAEIGRADIPQAPRLYESLRSPRTSRVQAASMENQDRFHLSDGPQQRTRDAQPGDASADWLLQAIAWVYGHDAEAIVDVGRRGTPNISRTLSSRSETGDSS